MMWKTILLGALVAVGAGTPLQARTQSIVVASTTSTQDSGLFGHILPLFKAKSGIDVRIVAQGTGQALDTGRRGDADVVFVHAKALEEKFIADGFGVRRFEVMYNDFVLIGPKTDPARVAGGKDIVAALQVIEAASAAFISRGDNSGTHLAELALWKGADRDPAGSKPAWYRQIGQGMGAALNTAAAMQGYVLSDRGTWLAFQNKKDLWIAVEGDKRLHNVYGIILVNPERHKHVKKQAGQAFIDWIVSSEGQAAIAAYRINGEPLFFPSAATTN